MTCRTTRTTICVLAALAATTPTLAQTSRAEVVFDIDSDTLLPGESTTVTLAAGWDGPWYSMCCVRTDLVASAGSTGWSDLSLIAPMAGPGTTPGTLGATGVEGIIAGQLNFPPGTPWEPDPNPLPFWRATYTAPTDVTVPFDIDLMTSTNAFDVYIEARSAVTQSLMDVLTEGQATIRVIPAPASTLVLAGLALAARRRR